MTQVVQARCPGCKRPLRIPSDWLSQAMRCRHCSMILQVRQPAASAGPATPVTTAPAAAPAAPTAVAARAPLASNPFADLALAQAEAEASPRRRRARRGSGGWWKGPVLALAVLVVAGVVTAANWSRLRPLLLPSDDGVAVSGDPVKSPEANTPAARPSAPANPKPRPQTGKKRPDQNKNPIPRLPPKGPEPREPADPPKTRPTAAKLMPRRALVVSIHDYLYAAPIHDGMLSMPSSITVNRMAEALADTALLIPLTQVAHLSDDAARGLARAPLRTVVEKTITSFLDSSREQDRILLVFIGHSVESDGKVYLAPIEGELDDPKTLMPLQWLYDQLAKCKARQKVLVLDVNRFHPTLGQERPGAEPMGPALDKACQNPPAGVQVWSACSLKQRSYETDESPEGVFVEALFRILKKGIPGRIQQPDDLLPVDQLVDRVNEEMKKDLGPHKLVQVSRLSGKPPAEGAAFDKTQAQPPEARLALAPVPGQGSAENKKLIEEVLDQVGTPPVKPTRDDVALRYEALPPFSAEAIKKFDVDKPKTDSKLRAAVHQARVALWAIAPVSEPKDLVPEVAKIKDKLRVNLSVLRDGYRAPPAANNGEQRFKGDVEKDEKNVAKIILLLEETLEVMESDEVKAERRKESPRWQANYDFMLARLQEQIAFLFEYQSLLGQMRREFPPRDPAVHSGWRLAAATTLQGDSRGKKLAKESRKLLDKVARDNAGTPWAVLAKREKLTALGLEWQASSNQ